MQVSHPTPLRFERAFSLVEVLIAAFLMAIVIAGATAMFANSSRAQSSARVKDRQTTLAAKVLATLQTDTSWSTWCRANYPTGTCDVTSWLSGQPRYADMGIIALPGQAPIRFDITVHAEGVDLPTDGIKGVGDGDKDGVVPDVYRLAVAVAPSSTLTSQYPQLRAISMHTEANPSIRVQAGRLGIDSCNVVNQLDERTTVADCDGGTGLHPLLPPPTLNTAIAGWPNWTCKKPAEALRGGDNRDCRAWKCANAEITVTQPGLDKPCLSPSYPRWFGGIRQPQFTNMLVEPSTGTMVVRSQDTGTAYSRPLVMGHAEFTSLPVGTYDIEFTQGGRQLWKSKSVPSSLEVSVEAGMKSRAVLMWKPARTGRVEFHIRSRNVTGPPWTWSDLPGFVSMNKDGSLITDGDVYVQLIPAPQGRLRLPAPVPPDPIDPDANPTLRINVPLSTTTQWFTFNDVPGGLYSFELSDPTYKSFRRISYTAGFVYVNGEDGSTYYGGPYSKIPEYINGLCAADIQDGWVAGGPLYYPGTTVLWVPKPCSSPAGGSPGGGSGGGGTS